MIGLLFKKRFILNKREFEVIKIWIQFAKNHYIYCVQWVFIMFELACFIINV